MGLGNEIDSWSWGYWNNYEEVVKEADFWIERQFC